MKKKGFTLVELLAVIAILTILTLVAVPIYTSYRCRAAWGEVQSCIADLSLRMENYYSNHGQYSADPWNDLGYGGNKPECGRYEAFSKVENNGRKYTIWFADTIRPTRCTTGSSLANDVWAMVNTEPGVNHVYNTVTGETDSAFLTRNPIP